MSGISDIARAVRYRLFDWGAARNSWTPRTHPWGTGDVTIVGPFVRPIGVAVGDDGHIYVADFDAHRVIRFDGLWTFQGWLGRPRRRQTGAATQGWRMHPGGAEHGDAAGEFQRPHAIAFNGGGNLLITELDNRRVQRFDADGRAAGMVPTAPVPDGAPTLVGPVTCTPGPDGALYVVDFRGHSIHRFDHDGRFSGWLGATDAGATLGFVMTGRSVPSSVAGGFNKPHVVRVTDDGSLLVADTWNHRVVRLMPDGAFAGWLGADADGPGSGWRSEGMAMASAAPGGFDAPTDICFLDDGDIVVAEYGNHRLQRFSASGAFRGWLGGRDRSGVSGGWRMDGAAGPGTAPGAFRHPYAVAASGGRLYVADTENGRIQVFSHD